MPATGRCSPGAGQRRIGSLLVFGVAFIPLEIRRYRDLCSRRQEMRHGVDGEHFRPLPAAETTERDMMTFLSLQPEVSLSFCASQCGITAPAFDVMMRICRAACRFREMPYRFMRLAADSSIEPAFLIAAKMSGLLSMPTPARWDAQKREACVTCGL